MGKELEINLLDYLDILLRKKWLIGLFILVFLALALLVSLLTKPSYKASSVVYLGKVAKKYKSARYLASLIKSDGFLNSLKKDLSFEVSSEQLRKDVSVQVIQEAVTFEVVRPEPNEAAEVANAIAKNFVNLNDFIESKQLALERKSTLEQSLKSVEAEIKELQREVSKAEAKKVALNEQDPRYPFYLVLIEFSRNRQVILEKRRLEFIEQIYGIQQFLASQENPEIFKIAEPPNQKYRPNVKLNLALGGFLGLLVSFLIVFFLEREKL